MTGCTPFLVNLLTTPPSRLGKADSVRLADKYEVDFCRECGRVHGGVEWVKGCIEHHRRRG